MRAGCASLALPADDVCSNRGCERALPLALPLEHSCSIQTASGLNTQRVPVALPAGRACSPPDPLHVMLDALSVYRFMLMVCSDLASAVACPDLPVCMRAKRLAYR